jgi:spermidine/putrescine transport system permease protein
VSLRRRVLGWLATRPRAGSAVLLAPGTAWLACFFVVPLLILLTYSVMPRGPHGGVAPGFTLEHYRRFLDPLYLFILGKTLWLSLVTTAVCLVLAYPTAWVIARSGRWRNLLLFLAVLPFWTSALVRTYAMMFLLRDTGLINRLLMDVGLIDAPIRMLYTEGAVLAGLVYGGLPFMILPIYASLEKLDPALLEAAEILGARSVARFTRVILPLTLPGVVAGSLLVFIPSIGSFVVPDLLGGAKQVLVGNLIQNQFGPARNWPFGSAAGFMVMGVVMVALWVTARRRDGGTA